MCAKFAIFEWQAVDSSAVLTQAPGVADSGAKWEIPAGFDTLHLSERALFAVTARLFRSPAHCGVNHDAEGEAGSGAPEDHDRPEKGDLATLWRPMYGAFVGD